MLNFATLPIITEFVDVVDALATIATIGRRFLYVRTHNKGRSLHHLPTHSWLRLHPPAPRGSGGEIVVFRTQGMVRMFEQKVEVVS